jgi:hypothetical protein
MHAGLDQVLSDAQLTLYIERGAKGEKEIKHFDAAGL